MAMEHPVRCGSLCCVCVPRLDDRSMSQEEVPLQAIRRALENDNSPGTPQIMDQAQEEEPDTQNRDQSADSHEVRDRWMDPQTDIWNDRAQHCSEPRGMARHCSDQIDNAQTLQVNHENRDRETTAHTWPQALGCDCEVPTQLQSRQVISTRGTLPSSHTTTFRPCDEPDACHGKPTSRIGGDT